MFINLHNHIFSQFDGFGKLEERIKFLIQNNQKAMAITEHGTMIGVYNFYSEMKKNNLKPIIGEEFYFIEGDDSVENSKRFHLLILAKNKKGYKSLLELQKIAYDNFYKKPLLVFNQLEKNMFENLIVSSACIGNNLAYHIINNDEKKAEEWLKKYLEIFPDFYLELQANKEEDYKKVVYCYKNFSEKYSIPIILTSDSHYTNKEDYLLHKLFVVNSMKGRKNIYDEEAFNYIKEDNLYLYNDESLEEEFKNILTKEEIEKYKNNTLEVEKKIHIYEIGEKNLQIPKPYIVKNKDSKALIKELCLKKIDELNLDEKTKKIYVDRMNEELEVINNNNYENYFLLLKEIIENIVEKNYGEYAIGLGRGSAGGCLVAYLLGITKVDAIKFNLSFERF